MNKDNIYFLKMTPLVIKHLVSLKGDHIYPVRSWLIAYLSLQVYLNVIYVNEFPKGFNRWFNRCLREIVKTHVEKLY